MPENYDVLIRAGRRINNSRGYFINGGDISNSITNGKDLQTNINFGDTVSVLKHPFNNYPPPIPNNYIDFMRLYFSQLDNSGFVNHDIPYFEYSFNYSMLNEMAKNGYLDYLVARMGLKYYSFFKIAEYNHHKNVFVNIRTPIESFNRAGAKIEECFYELKNQLEVSDSSIGNLLINNFNNVIDTLTTEILKMEEINMSSLENSQLGNVGCGVSNPNQNPSSVPNNALFGGSNDLYCQLMQMLANINYNLSNPKIPSGMVSNKELILELEKIKPGVPRDELSMILAKYPTLDAVDLKLSTYLSKAENSAILSAYLLKADAVNFVTSDMMGNYYTAREIDGITDKFLLKTEYKPLEAYNKTEIDAKLSEYYKSHVVDLLLRELARKEYVDQNFYNKEMISELLSKYLPKDEYTSSYSKLEMDAFFANYYSKVEIEAKNSEINDKIATLVTKEEADATYLRKEDVPSADTDLSSYATKEYADNAIVTAKSEIVTESDRKYATQNQVTTSLADYTRNTEFQAAKQALEQKDASIEEKVTTLEGKVAILEGTAGGSAAPGTDHTTEIQALQQKDTEIEGRLGTVESGLANKADTSALDAKADASALAAKAEQSALEAANAEIAALKEKNTTLEGKVATLEGDLATEKGKVTALESEITGIKSRLDTLEAPKA